MWTWVEEKIMYLSGETISINYDQICRGAFPKLQRRDTCLCLIYNAAQTALRYRMKITMEKHTPNKKVTLNILKANIALRIKADQSRLTDTDFEKRWGREI